MGKIVISANVTLDGVVQDPAGDEGFARGGWFGRIGDNDRAEWAKAELGEALGAAALLLGRRSYEWFAARWPSRTGALAERLTSMPKYVVSSTLRDPGWNNSTLLTGDALTGVATLRQRLTGDVVVYGSFRLGHALMEHDLVDELRLMIYPVVIGTGRRLFSETGGIKPMRLISNRAVGESLAFLTYQPVRDA
ncbi:MAG: dihydrofolate reductase family protein [Actinobacteria bacterium]|nr:dihydrofolate reductase family protein [Actinomycetota bacterium]MBO0787163.1 dihydrofolate reductase family protein [Actinomycetota bacterium]